MRVSIPTLFIIVLTLGACAPEPTETPLPQSLVMATQVVVAATEAAALESTRSLALTQQAAATDTQAAVIAGRDAALGTRTVEQAQSGATATAVVMEVYDEMDWLASQGYLGDYEGGYVNLPDFNEAWAQIDYFDAWYTGYSPANFVISADLEWSLASRAANAFNSGCGFLFRSDDDVSRYYMLYLALDGSIDLSGRINHEVLFRDHRFYQAVDFPSGQAHIVLVVQGTTITAFIDGQKAYERNDGLSGAGHLFYTLVSGTNAGYGMRCKMTNTWLWDLDSVPEEHNDPQAY